jgi:hypothetical protein
VLFGECTLAGPAPSGARACGSPCAAHDPARESVSLEVDSGAPLDLVELVCNLLEPRPGVNCTVSERPEGWSLISLADSRAAGGGGAAPRARAHGRAAPELLPRLRRVGAARRVQRDVLILHGASLGVGGAGVLLAGRGGAGRPARADARVARTRFARRRHGGAARADARAAAVPAHDPHPARRARGERRARAAGARRDGDVRELDAARARAAARLFPGDEVASAPLRAAFFLRAFRKTAALERFTPSLSQLEPLRPLAVRLQWGIAPARRMVRFGASRAVHLARVPLLFPRRRAPGRHRGANRRILEEQ